MRIILSYASYRLTDAVHDVGGEERVAWETARELAARGHVVYAYSPIVELSCTYDGILPITFPGCDFKNEARWLRRVAKALRFGRQSRRHIRRLLARERIDVVHHLCPAYPGFSSSVSDVATPFVYGPATVSYDRGIEGGRSRHLISRLYEQMKRRAYERTLSESDLILVEVPHVTRWIPECERRKVRVFYNSIDCSDYVPTQTPGCNAPDGAPVSLIFHGGIRRNKGIHYLLHAIRHLVDQRSAVPHLHLYGKLLDPSLRTLANDLEIGDHVTFAGPVSQEKIPGVLDRNAIYVFPTLQDNCPKGLLEAMAMGMPIVTTNVMDIPRIVRHEREGLVVPARDSVGLAGAITRLLADGSLRSALGRAARERCLSEFSLHDRINQLISLYFELASGRA